MRKLTRVSGVAAAALAVAVTAGAFTFTVAPRSAPAAGPGHGGQHRGLPSPRSRLRPGGPAVIAHGQRARAPRPQPGTSSERSLNWGGYAASGNRFRYVQATFFVPYVDCQSTPNAYSAHWAGLDGLNNGTVEQAGISAGCNGSTPEYRAWYEMAPQLPMYQRITVRPGDSIVASVSYHRSTRTFTLSLTDTTNGHHFSHTTTCPARASCSRASAEAISEAALGPSGYLPLANFRGEGYSSIQVTSQAGQRGGLRSSHWRTVRITTISNSGAVLDQPTSLYRGTAFGMYWQREK